MQILHTELMCSVGVGPSWIGWRPQPLLPVQVLYNISYANNAAVPGETGKSETSSPVHTRYMSHDNVGERHFWTHSMTWQFAAKIGFIWGVLFRQSNPLPPIKHGESRFPCQGTHHPFEAAESAHRVGELRVRISLKDDEGMYGFLSFMSLTWRGAKAPNSSFSRKVDTVDTADTEIICNRL